MTDKAIAEFKQILILVPGNPHIHYNLGLAYSSKGLYDEAIKEFKETLRLNSYDHDARQRFERIGKLIQQPSKWYETRLCWGSILAKAVSAFEEAVRLNPDDRAAQQNIKAR